MIATLAPFEPQWREFYSAVAGMGATLLGLAFVSFQVAGVPKAPRGASRWAIVLRAQVLFEFLVPMLIGLSALAPDERWWTYVVVFASTAGLVLVVVVCGSFWLDGQRDQFAKIQVGLNVLPVIVYTLMLYAVIADFHATNVVGGGVLWLFLSGSVESFWLVKQGQA